MADDRTYIRVHDGMDEHPKIEGLSDAAFRALHRCWYYVSRQRTNGKLTDAAWKNRAKTPRVRRELVDAGLAHLPGYDCPHPDCPPALPGHVQMHDYLDHQRSAEEIRLLQETRGDTGSYGNHVRWHVVRRKPKGDCEHCQKDGTDPVANGSQMGSQTDRKPIASTETETETEEKNSLKGGSHVSRGSRSTPPPRFPDHCSEHADEPVPGPCGDCADARKARAAMPRLTLVESPTQKCLIHMTPDVAHCTGCAADRLAGESA